MKQRESGIIHLIPLILVAVVIVVIAAGAFYFSQNSQKPLISYGNDALKAPEATSNNTKMNDWLSYNGDRFSFLYPSNMNKVSSSNSATTYLETQNFKIGDKEAYQIEITLVRNSPNTLLKEKENINKNSPEYSFISDRSILSLSNNVDALITTYKSDWSIYKKYYLTNGKIGIYIKGTGNDQALLDQILSTFKFTEGKSPDKDLINEAVKLAFNQKVGQEPTTQYGIADDPFVEIGDWAFGILTVAPVGEGSGPGAHYYLARKVNGKWQGAIEYTDQFNEWLKIVPDGFVNPDLKKAWQ